MHVCILIIKSGDVHFTLFSYFTSFELPFVTEAVKRQSSSRSEVRQQERCFTSSSICKVFLKYPEFNINVYFL